MLDNLETRPLADPDRFGYEDVTGKPWIEIDFPQDLARARAEVLPAVDAVHLDRGSFQHS